MAYVRSGGVPGRSPFPHPGAMFGGGMMASPMMMGMPAAPGGVLPQQQVATPQAGQFGLQLGRCLSFVSGGDLDAGEKADEKPAEKKKEPAKSVVTIKLVSYNTEKKVSEGPRFYPQ